MAYAWGRSSETSNRPNPRFLRGDRRQPASRRSAGRFAVEGWPGSVGISAAGDPPEYASLWAPVSPEARGGYGAAARLARWPAIVILYINLLYFFTKGAVLLNDPG